MIQRENYYMYMYISTGHVRTRTPHLIIQQNTHILGVLLVSHVHVSKGRLEEVL